MNRARSGAVPAPLPADEEPRLAALRRTGILDTAPELAFDQLVDLAADICGTSTALVSLIDTHRQWFKARTGTDLRETTRELAFCAHAILQDDVFEVPDTLADERFRFNPLVTGGPRIRFYAGAPVRAIDGHKLGTLCVVSQEVRTLTPMQRRALRTLALQVETLIQLRIAVNDVADLSAELGRHRDALAAAAIDQRAWMRHVVHDLRGPLAVTLSEAQLLQMPGATEADRAESADSIIRAARSMAQLTLNILDISRSENGALPLHTASVEVAEVAREAVREAPRRRFGLDGTSADVSLDDAGGELVAVADPQLVRRILDNLIDNALKYGERTPVAVAVRARDAWIEVQVSDRGPGMRAPASTHGYGLGLVFCEAAVIAQGGRLSVAGNLPRGTIVSFTLPRA